MKNHTSLNLPSASTHCPVLKIAVVAALGMSTVTHAAPAADTDALRSEVRRALDGYNYVMKTGSDGAIESVVVSGENGSGAQSGANAPDPVASAVQLADAQMPAQPTIALQEKMQGQAAIEALGGQLEAVAASHGLAADRFKQILLEDPSAWIDHTGRLFYVENPEQGGDNPQQQGAGVVTAGGAAAGSVSMDLTKTFLLHSRPGASRVIYLDFNGHKVAGSAWNTSFGKPLIEAPAFSLDADANGFSDAEKTRIQNIWLRVAEDYAAFDVDVTTEEPAPTILERTSSTDQTYGSHAVITKNVLNCSCGGIAYVGIFDYLGSAYKPAWIFYDMLSSGNEKYVAEAVSHEVGHNLGLNHDGTASVGYYQGHGTGATGWAPIMGVGYYKELSQWSSGEYTGANNKQDDVAIIQSHGAVIRPDDAGNTTATAATLSGTTSGASFLVDQSGNIESRADVDFFVFSTAGGTVNLAVDPAGPGGNLDVAASLYASNGTLVSTSNPPDALNASISATLSAGTYYLKVDGVGKPATPTDPGYSDYGSFGQYRITGSLNKSAALAPVAAATASPSSGTAPLTVGLSSSGSKDDGVIVGYNWNFGDGTAASTQPNPQHVFTVAGTYPVKLTVTDNLGLTHSTTVNVTVTAPVATTVSRVAAMAMALSVAPTTTQAYALAQVTDAKGKAVPGAVVTGKWGGVLSGTGSALSNSSGIVMIPSAVSPVVKGTFSFTVTGISKTGYTYDPAKNAISSMSMTR